MRAGRLALLFALLIAGPFARGAETDPQTGLAVDERLSLVRANCTPCHSAKLITQNRATRDGWLGMIRWMQRTQKLWAFPPVVEEALLDYLSQHYGVSKTRQRRPPIPRALLPPKASATTR